MNFFVKVGNYSPTLHGHFTMSIFSLQDISRMCNITEILNPIKYQKIMEIRAFCNNSPLFCNISRAKNRLLPAHPEGNIAVFATFAVTFCEICDVSLPCCAFSRYFSVLYIIYIKRRKSFVRHLQNNIARSLLIWLGKRINRGKLTYSICSLHLMLTHPPPKALAKLFFL